MKIVKPIPAIFSLSLFLLILGCNKDVTGFGMTEITGTINTIDASRPAGSVPAAAILTVAKGGDLTTAYNDAAGRTATDLVLLS